MGKITLVVNDTNLTISVYDDKGDEICIKKFNSLEELNECIQRARVKGIGVISITTFEHQKQ